MNSLEAGFDAAFEVKACQDQVNLFILANQIHEGDLQLIFGIAELLFDFPNRRRGSSNQAIWEPFVSE